MGMVNAIHCCQLVCGFVRAYAHAAVHRPNTGSGSLLAQDVGSSWPLEGVVWQAHRSRTWRSASGKARQCCLPWHTNTDVPSTSAASQQSSNPWDWAGAHAFFLRFLAAANDAQLSSAVSSALLRATTEVLHHAAATQPSSVSNYFTMPL